MAAATIFSSSLGVAAADAQDQGEVAAGFGEQVPAVEAAAVVHHEHPRGDVDSRQGDVDHGGDPGPDRGSRSTGVLEEGVNDVDGHPGSEDRAPLPPRAQLGERLGLLLGRASLAVAIWFSLARARSETMGRNIGSPSSSTAVMYSCSSSARQAAIWSLRPQAVPGPPPSPRTGASSTPCGARWERSARPPSCVPGRRRTRPAASGSRASDRIDVASAGTGTGRGRHSARTRVPDTPTRRAAHRRLVLELLGRPLPPGALAPRA